MATKGNREARRDERILMQGAVVMSWQTPGGETHTVRGTFRDISQEGARVECSQPIAVRSNVYVQAPSYGLMGNATVRHCRRHGLKFSIGLEFSWAGALAEKGRKHILDKA